MGYFISSFLLVLLLIPASLKLKAQQKNYSIQANIIYHFTKYIDWPPSSKNEEFVIGVMGDSPIFEELKDQIGHKLANGRKIIIKKYSSNSNLFNCHILFISEDESRNIRKIAKQTEQQSILLVSEEAGLAKKGSCINFIIVEEHLKLEINKKNIEQRNLEIATELLQLGTIVK
jgi:hypothetical protein